MTYENTKFNRPENVGYVESVIRGSVSIALLVATMLIPEVSSYALFALTQIAIYLGLTAFIGWDPIYAMKKQTAENVSAQGPVTAVSPEVQPQQVSGGDHKKAA